MEFQSVVLFVLVVGFAESCDSSCYFIYDNRTGNVTRDAVKPWNTTELLGDDVGELVYRGAGGKLKGLITVKGGYDEQCRGKYGGLDYLRFRKSGSWYQPIAFEFKGDSLANLYVYGEIETNPGNSEVTTSRNTAITDWKKDSNVFDIQISDSTAVESEGFYDIYVNTKNVPLNYGSKDEWKLYSVKRLNTADNIRSDLYCTHYTSIMICDNSQPKICSLDGPVKPLDLGDSYTLTCKGAGSPILEVTWEKPNESVVSETQTLNEDNDVITSTLTIQKYSTSDSGVYNCTVRNQNYGDKATNTFDMTYTQEVIVTPPAVTYYKKGEGDTVFVWYISGWPLEEVKLVCNQTDVPAEVYAVTETEKRFTFKRTIEDTFAMRNCIVYNNESMLDNLNITRVGFNCRTGYYGQGKDCLLCPFGQTSLAKSDDLNNCYDVSSQCIAGDYGIERVCSPCPDGRTSEDYTVKEGDCFEKPGISAAIIGGVAGGGGGLVAVLIVVLLVVLYIRKKSSSKEKQAESRAAVPEAAKKKPRPVNVVPPLGKQRKGKGNLMTQQKALSDGVCSQLDHHQDRAAVIAGEPGEDDGLYARINHLSPGPSRPPTPVTTMSHQSPGPPAAEDDGLYARIEDRHAGQEMTFSNLLAQDEEEGDALYTQIDKTPRLPQAEEGLYADQRPDFQQEIGKVLPFSTLKNFQFHSSAFRVYNKN